MKKIFFLILISFTTKSFAFHLDDSDIKLLCPFRGQIEIILHHYGHTQESWGEREFETGGGHSIKGPVLMVQFANLDEFIFNKATGVFSFWYADKKQLVNCQPLKIGKNHQVNINYYRE